jgi:hypothetical protein
VNVLPRPLFAENGNVGSEGGVRQGMKLVHECSFAGSLPMSFSTMSNLSLPIRSRNSGPKMSF